MHEREWRLPLHDDQDLRLDGLAAILIGDPTWRPSPTGTGTWMDESTGERHPGPVNPYCIEEMNWPLLWRQSPIWAWDQAGQRIVTYAPGILC